MFLAVIDYGSRNVRNEREVLVMNKILKIVENEVPIEIIVEAITSISQGLKKLRNTRLNDKALMLLIQHSAPMVGTYSNKRIGINDIKAVFEGIESLEETYLKKKKETK